MQRPLVLAAAVLSVLTLAGCDAATSSTPAKPPPTAAPAPDGSSWTVTHILVAHSKSPAPQHKEIQRTKAEALALAKSLLVDLANGRSFDELVKKFTDDRDAKKVPNTNNETPGSYTFGPGMMVPAFEKAARDTAVGKVTPEPVETDYGYHIIRRDR